MLGQTYSPVPSDSLNTESRKWKIVRISVVFYNVQHINKFKLHHKNKELNKLNFEL